MSQHLFRYIDLLFRPKNPLDVAKEEPILLNKLEKGNMQLIVKKTVLVWAIDTSHQILTLPRTRRGELSDVLAATPNQAARTSKNKLYRLQGRRECLAGCSIP